MCCTRLTFIHVQNVFIHHNEFIHILNWMTPVHFCRLKVPWYCLLTLLVKDVQKNSLKGYSCIFNTLFRKILQQLGCKIQLSNSETNFFSAVLYFIHDWIIYIEIFKITYITFMFHTMSPLCLALLIFKMRSVALLYLTSASRVNILF